MPTVFIGVGSNLGDRPAFLEQARQALLAGKKVRNLRASPVYETDPVDAAGGKYLNAVWSFETDLDPRGVLAMLQAIEKKAGRVRKAKNDPRVLDLDLLFYDDLVMKEPGLEVPHPRIAKRDFVLRPFCDLEPDWKHPVLKKTIKELFIQLSVATKT